MKEVLKNQNEKTFVEQTKFNEAGLKNDLPLLLLTIEKIIENAKNRPAVATISNTWKARKFLKQLRRKKQERISMKYQTEYLQSKKQIEQDYYNKAKEVQLDIEAKRQWEKEANIGYYSSPQPEKPTPQKE